MKRRKLLTAVLACLLLTDLATAEVMPRAGTFTDFYFKDRWGQGVFGNFFVAPSLHKRLNQETWRPISITATDIRQPSNPGSAMIHGLRTIKPVVVPAVEMKIKLDESSIPLGTNTTFRMIVTNRSDHALEFDRRRLRLLTTVHRRGTHPSDSVKHDGIYGSQINSYGFGSKSKAVVRSTSTGPVLEGAGDIKMRSGRLVLSKRASIPLRYHEQRPIISPGASREFIYQIGDGWWMNEYELQVRYQQVDKEYLQSITSPPVSFDVVAPKRIDLNTSIK